jgi:hypothetical protein
MLSILTLSIRTARFPIDVEPIRPSRAGANRTGRLAALEVADALVAWSALGAVVPGRTVLSVGVGVGVGVGVVFAGADAAADASAGAGTAGTTSRVVVTSGPIGTISIASGSSNLWYRAKRARFSSVPGSTLSSGRNMGLFETVTHSTGPRRIKVISRVPTCFETTSSGTNA